MQRKRKSTFAYKGAFSTHFIAHKPAYTSAVPLNPSNKVPIRQNGSDPYKHRSSICLPSSHHSI